MPPLALLGDQGLDPEGGARDHPATGPGLGEAQASAEQELLRNLIDITRRSEHDAGRWAPESQGEAVGWGRLLSMETHPEWSRPVQEVHTTMGEAGGGRGGTVSGTRGGPWRARREGRSRRGWKGSA